MGTRTPRTAMVASAYSSITEDLRRVADELPLLREPDLALLEPRLMEIESGLGVLRDRMDWLRWCNEDAGRPRPSRAR